MRYPILVEEGTGTSAFGVVVPDLPGCFSAGDTLDEAVEAAKEAAAAWIDRKLITAAWVYTGISLRIRVDHSVP